MALSKCASSPVFLGLVYLERPLRLPLVLCSSLPTKTEYSSCLLTPTLTQVRIKPRTWSRELRDSAQFRSSCLMCLSPKTLISAPGNRQRIDFFFFNVPRLGVLAHNCNTSSWEVKAGRSGNPLNPQWVWSHPRLRETLYQKRNVVEGKRDSRSVEFWDLTPLSQEETTAIRRELYSKEIPAMPRYIVGPKTERKGAEKSKR